MIFSQDHLLNQFPTWMSGDHWDRHLVSGRGIICGFEWFTEQDCTLRLCGGTGITSDGTLVCTEKKEYLFTHCRSFAAPDYPLFKNGESELLAWELLEGRPPDAGSDEVFPLTPQNEAEEKNLRLNEKVIIVFLDKGSITDNPPPSDVSVAPVVLTTAPAAAPPEEPLEVPKATQEYHLRFLLMNQGDIVKALGLEERALALNRSRQEEDEDYIYSEDYATDDDLIDEKILNQAADPRLDWPEIRLGRFGYGGLNPFNYTDAELNGTDFPPATGATPDNLYDNYVYIIDRATKDLEEATGQLQAWLTEHFYCFENPKWAEWLGLLCAKWEAYKSLNQVKLATNHKKELVQYFYGWCRDLIRAYEELCEAVRCWSATCRAQVEEHPCHLFVGLAMRSPESYFPPAFRHNFQSPPSFHDAARLREEVRIHHHRLLLMIQSFYLPNAIPDDAINPFCVHEREGNAEELPDMSTIKLTPGRYYDQALGHQSIPFYYPLSDDTLSLHHFWSPVRSRNLRTEWQRSYHASLTEGSYSDLLQATHPLRFNIDADDFIRVEGHIGKTVEEVLDVNSGVDQFKAFRERHNLTFEVKMVALSDLFKTEGSENYFADAYRGAEHLAGVRPGGTLILVKGIIPSSSNEIIIADFSLPHQCCNQDEVSHPVEKVEISGEVQSCIEEILLPDSIISTNLTGVTTTTGTNGRFSLNVPRGADFEIQINHLGFAPSTRGISSATETDLGVIVLYPSFVTIPGRVHFTGDPASKATVRISVPDLPDSAVFTDADGQFALQNVPRSASELTYIAGGVEGTLDLILGNTCDRLSPPLDINANIGSGSRGNIFVSESFEFDGALTDRVFNSLDIVRDSEAGRTLMADYTTRFNRNTSALVTDLNLINPSPTNREDLATALTSLNLEESNLNNVHRIYRKGMAALANEAVSSPEGSLPAIERAEENLTKVYLDRVALTKQDTVTLGTLNALKSSVDLGSNIDLNRITTEWSEEMAGRTTPILLETFNKFAI